MTIIKVSNFKGMRPLESPKLLPNNFAQTATNVELSRGKIQPLAETDIQGTVQKATPVKIFKHSTKWVCWASVVNHVRSWIYDTNPRLYFTDGSQPSQTKLDIINDCLSSGSADTTYDLGIDAPSTAPSLAMTYNGGTPGDDIQITVNYVYTYVTSWGEESAPSPPSGTTDVYDDGYVTVTCPTPTDERAASTLITKIRIYRLNTGVAGADYQYLTEQTINDTTYAYDDRDGANWAVTPSADLGAVISTEDYDAPPATMTGLFSFANGMMAGFVSNKLYLNEPFIPYAFPEKYIKEVESDIVGLGGYLNILVIVTDTGPYTGIGIDPNSMVVEKIPYDEGGVAARGIVSTPYGVIYPSSNGLIMFTPGSGLPINITEKIYTKAQWQALTPANLISCFFDGKYFGFFINTNDGFYFDFLDETPYFVTLDLNEYPSGNAVQIKDVYVDPTSDTLFLLVYSADTSYYVLKFNKHSTNKLTFTYKGKIFSLDRPENLGCYRLKKDTGTITLKVYAGGALKTTASVTTENPGRLASGFTLTDWEFQVSGSSNIDEIALASTMDEL